MQNSISDSIPLSGSSVRLPAPRLPVPPARRQRILVRGAGLLACLDSLMAVVAILSVLISVNLPNVSGGLNKFLATRISLKNVLLLIFLATVWPALFHLFRLYEARPLQQFGSELRRLLAATAAGTAVACIFPLTSISGSVTMGDLRYFWITATALCLLLRIGRRAVDRARYRQIRRAIIVGTGPLARRVFRDLRSDTAARYDVVNFVDEHTEDSPKADWIPAEKIRALDALEQLLMRQVIDEVLIALPVKSCYQQIQYAIAVCERAGVQSKYGADLFESKVASPRYDAQGERAFVAMQVAPDGYQLIVKRMMDLAGAAVALVLLAPLILVVAITIKLTSRGPIIYSQDRCGLAKRPFRMFKFRTMLAEAETLQASLEERNEASGPVFKISNDPRITPLGRFLRKSSLDELPQLWNVLRGEMSLVGPRPLPWRDVQRITQPSDMRRFSMRPGLTCLWQVQGRSTIDFERWVELDLKYIDSWSLLLDFGILVRTLPAVLSGKGAT